jgi:hypothetical protein
VARRSWVLRGVRGGLGRRYEGATTRSVAAPDFVYCRGADAAVRRCTWAVKHITELSAVRPLLRQAFQQGHISGPQLRTVVDFESLRAGGPAGGSSRLFAPFPHPT